MKGDWKGRLYQAYVSSGQAGLSADSGEVPALKEGLAARFVTANLPRERDARIIDLGCGYGAILYFLVRAGYRNVSGVDISAEQIALAHRLGLTQAECGSILSFLEKTADASVDVVLAIDIVEHLVRAEMFEVLDQIFRILKPGGMLIAHVPNAEGIYGMRVRYGDLTHEQAFTPRSAEQLFSAIGFSKITCHENRPMVRGLKGALRRVVWDLGTLPHRFLLGAETGRAGGFVLSQNFFIRATK